MKKGHWKVLFVAYYYPPLTTSGVARSVGFCRHLPMFGWKPSVVSVKKSKDRWVMGKETPDVPGLDVFRAPELNLDSVTDFLQGATNRIFRAFGKTLKSTVYRDHLCIPDSHIGWLVLPKLLRMARSHDVIYVSCSPFSAAIHAVMAGRMSSRPVVLDFRDAWTLNPHAGHRMRFYNWANRKLEAWSLKHASKVVVNTEGALSLYQNAYPGIAEKFIWIPNGFDRINLPEVKQESTKRKYRIVHVGSFYGTRQPTLLIDAINCIQDIDIEFVQVGPVSEVLNQHAQSAKVRITGALSPSKALDEMRDADVLYLKQGFETGVSDYIAVAAKTYEYLATGLPILVDCPPGDNRELVTEYSDCAVDVTRQDLVGMVKAVREVIKVAKINSPQISPRFERTFSRPHLTSRLSLVLDATHTDWALRQDSGTRVRARRAIVNRTVRDTGLTKPIRAIRRLWDGELNVLAYHRVVQLDQPGMFPFDIAQVSVTPDNFRRQLEIVGNETRIISLHELHGYLDLGEELPRGCTLLTFDDGYADFYENAYPIMQAFAVPSVLFVATDYIGANTTFWYEEVTYMILKSENRVLSLDSIKQQYDIGEQNSGFRRKVAEKIVSALKYVSNEARLSAIEQVKVQTEFGFGEAKSKEANMAKTVSWAQLKEMSENQVVVGAHSVSHPILTQLKPENVRFEIRESKNVISKNLGLDVDSFAFPNGQKGDFDELTIQEVKSAGFKSAFTYLYGSNRLRNLERFALRRIHIDRATNEAELVARLRVPGLFR